MSTDSQTLPIRESKNPAPPGPGALGREHPLSVIESVIDPGMLVLSLWGVGLYFEKTLHPS